MGDCPAYALSGDVTLSAEDLTIVQPHALPAGKELQPVPVDHKSSYANDEDDEEYDEYDEEEEPHHTWLGGSTAVKFLLAGGVAGAGTLKSSVLHIAC